MRIIKKLHVLIRIELVFLLFFIDFPVSLSQTAKESLFTDIIIDTKVHYGTIFPHRKFMRHLVTGHSTFAMISLSKQLYGNKPWERIYNYPTKGIAFHYINLGNPEQLGNAYGIYPYISFPCIRSKNYTFSYRWGTGAGFIEKPFNREDNYKNNAVSTKINFLLSVILESRWEIHNRLSLTADFGFTHMSNGDVKLPNLGINIADFGLGVSYNIAQKGFDRKDREKEFVFRKDTLPEPDKGLAYTFIAAFGVKEITPVDVRTYLVYTIYSNFTKPVGKRRRLGLGIDIFYDGSNIVLYNNNKTNTFSDKEIEFIKSGIHFSHELVIGKFLAVTEIGVYINNKYKGDGPIYHRVALRHYIYKNILFNFSIKSHWANADYIEWGLGYRF